MVTTVLHCDCGFEASAPDAEKLAAVVRRHSWEEHGMALSRDEALLLASRATPGRKAQPRKPREVQHRSKEEE